MDQMIFRYLGNSSMGLVKKMFVVDGQWTVTEQVVGAGFEYYHRPFIEDLVQFDVKGFDPKPWSRTQGQIFVC